MGQGVGVELNVQYSTAEWFPSGLMAIESMADTALLPLELGRMGHRFSPCIPCQRRDLYMLCVCECERTGGQTSSVFTGSTCRYSFTSACWQRDTCDMSDICFTLSTPTHTHTHTHPHPHTHTHQHTHTHLVLLRPWRLLCFTSFAHVPPTTWIHKRAACSVCTFCMRVGGWSVLVSYEQVVSYA